MPILRVRAIVFSATAMTSSSVAALDSTAPVQVAKQHDAFVYATASARNQGRLRELGAEIHIGHAAEHLGLAARLQLLDLRRVGLAQRGVRLDRDQRVARAEGGEVGRLGVAGHLRPSP